MNITILKNSGFCNGVTKTLRLINDVIESNKYNKIYVVGKLIHNEKVINYYKNKGIIFIDMDGDCIQNLSYLTSKDCAIFSADGHKKTYESILNLKGIDYYDGICFNINKLMTFIDFYKNQYPIIFVGKKNHDESIVATSNSNVYFYDVSSNTNNFDIKSNTVILTFQTTLSQKDVDNISNKIKKMFNEVIINNSLCGQVLKRIEDVKSIPNDATKIIVVGCTTSSNTDQIYKAAKESHNCEVYKINSIEDISFTISDNDNIYITSGCSGSKETIDEIVNYLKGTN